MCVVLELARRAMNLFIEGNDVVDDGHSMSLLLDGHRIRLEISPESVAEVWSRLEAAGRDLGSDPVAAVSRLLGVYLFEAMSTISTRARTLTFRASGFYPDVEDDHEEERPVNGWYGPLN